MKGLRVMGIVNVTPDSFSDGGKFFSPDEAVRRARNMISEGADIIDIGGESTRPDSKPISWQEEWDRIEPVLVKLLDKSAHETDGILVSVDTYHPETAEKATAMGVGMINCVKAGSVPDMADICLKSGVELVIPYRIQDDNRCFDLEDLKKRGLSLYLDPMIGFGTTREEDIALLGSVPRLALSGRVLIGASRKRIVKKLIGEKTPGKDIAGNLAIAMWAVMNGASAVRVHDVKETVQAFRVLAALRERE